jgi:hypothetical protein
MRHLKILNSGQVISRDELELRSLANATRATFLEVIINFNKIENVYVLYLELKDKNDKYFLDPGNVEIISYYLPCYHSIGVCRLGDKCLYATNAWTRQKERHIVYSDDVGYNVLHYRIAALFVPNVLDDQATWVMDIHYTYSNDNEDRHLTKDQVYEFIFDELVKTEEGLPLYDHICICKDKNDYYFRDPGNINFTEQEVKEICDILKQISKRVEQGKSYWKQEDLLIQYFGFCPWCLGVHTAYHDCLDDEDNVVKSVELEKALSSIPKIDDEESKYHELEKSLNSIPKIERKEIPSLQGVDLIPYKDLTMVENMDIPQRFYSIGYHVTQDTTIDYWFDQFFHITDLIEAVGSVFRIKFLSQAKKSAPLIPCNVYMVPFNKRNYTQLRLKDIVPLFGSNRQYDFGSLEAFELEEFEPVITYLSNMRDVRGNENRFIESNLTPLLIQKFRICNLLDPNPKWYDVMVSPLFVASIIKHSPTLSSLAATGRSKLDNLCAFYNLPPQMENELAMGSYWYAYCKLKVQEATIPLGIHLN